MVGGEIYLSVCSLQLYFSRATVLQKALGIIVSKCITICSREWSIILTILGEKEFFHIKAEILILRFHFPVVQRVFNLT